MVVEHFKQVMESRHFKKVRYLLFLAALIFFIFFIRGCSMSMDGHAKSLYRIGRDASWPSIDFMGKERNVSAFIDDLFTTIAANQNLKVQIIVAQNIELLEALRKGEIDGAVLNLQSKLQNEKTLIFSDPFFYVGPVLVVRVDSKLKGWEEIKSKIVGISSQSPLILEISKDSSIQLHLYDDILRALTDLEEGRIDGVILPVFPAYVYTRTFYAGNLKVATAPLNNEGLRLVALNNPEGENLIEQFNAGLTKLKEDKEYHKLMDNWGLMDVEEVGSFHPSNEEQK
jgi:polar amino acid transport system substrate-binding protein